MSALVELAGVRFAYAPEPGDGRDEGRGFELRVEHLALAPGERVACIGPSGCGKTTLIQLVAGIVLPREGSVRFGETRLETLSAEARRALRVRRIGMVFQDFALLEYASALDNVLLPYLLSPHLERTRAVEARARELLARLGIEHLARRKPGRLSQGERQRVALCRALVTEPELLLCDEATGNLDPDSAARALDLLLGQAERSGAGVFLVTHDHSVLGRFERVVDLRTLVARHAPESAPGGAPA